MLEAPITSSIFFTSAGDGPMWRAAKSFSAVVFMNVLSDQRLIGALVHEPFNLGGIGNLHLEQPAISHRIGLDESRLTHRALIYLRHLAADRRIYVRCRLDRLDHGRSGSRFELSAHRRQLYEDEVSQLLLRVLRNSDGGNVAVDAQPFVILGEFEHGIFAQAMIICGACNSKSRRGAC